MTPEPKTSREKYRAELANSWTVGTTSMSETQARAAAQLIVEHLPGVWASPTDPRAFLTIAIDRWTAETLQDGLRRTAAAGGEVGSLRETVEDFLAYGYDEDGHCPGVE